VRGESQRVRTPRDLARMIDEALASPPGEAEAES